MAEEFIEEDLRAGIPAEDIPESGFAPITMTLEPPREVASPRQFVPFAAEDVEAPFQPSLPQPATQDIAELEAGGFQWPAAEPVYPQAPPIISIAPERPQYEPVSESYAKASDYFNNGFRDEKFLAQESDIPTIRELEKKSFDPANVRIRAWNWGYLQWRSGKRFQSDAEYEAARDEDNRQRNPNKPVTSDIDYFNNRKKEAEFEHERKQASMDLLSKAILKGATDYAQGKPIELMPLLDEVRQKYPALNDPETEKNATLALRSAASHIKQTLDPLMPKIGKMMPFVQNLAVGKDMDESIAQLKTLLLADVKTKADLTPDKIEQIDELLGYTALGLHSLDPEGKNRNKVFAAFDNLKKALVRPIAAQGLFGFGGRDATLTMQEEMVLEARRRLDVGQDYVFMPDGRPRFLEPGEAVPTGSRLATPEERANFIQRTDDLMLATWFEDKIRERLERDIDPIKTVLPGFAGRLERTMVYGVLQSAGFMATGILPRGVADVMWWWTTRNSEFRQLMRDNPTMAREDASSLANWSASWQAPLNRVEGEVLYNTLPGLKGIIKDVRGGNWKSAAVKFGLSYAAEAAAENTQNFISNVTQAYGNQIADAKRATDPSWAKASEKAFRETIKEMPDTLLTIAPLMMIGAGITHLTDYRMEQFAIAGLMSQGLSREQAKRVMAKSTWEEREKQFQKEYQNRDPEAMREANARNAAVAAEGQAQFDKQATAPAMPSIESRRLDDGTEEYTVRDPAGNVVMTTTNRTVLEGVYQEQVEKALLEHLLAQEAAAATEEGQAATAEAEGALRVLEPESRTSAAYLLEFEDEQRPTPERAAAVARLEAALAADPRSGGRPVKLIAQTRRVGAATVSGQKLNETIDSLSRLFGKDIVFVRSGTGEDLPFTGIVNPSDPNTIFLDAAGDRNVLALIGHEWSHTLKLTNPQLHAAMVAQMRPLVFEWLNQEAKLRKEEGYTEAQVTDELVGNIFGDALTRPDFLRLLAQRNPSLFERVVKAIEEFFQSLIAAARGSEWATEGFITDLEAMHGIIASTIEQARTAGPEVTAAPAAEAELRFARARDESYRAIDQQWWKDFAAWEEGTFHAPKLFQFGPPSDEQIAGGFPDGEIVMAPRILEEKPAKHGFKARELFNLPKRLRDPIAIFQSRTEPDARTVLTTIEHEGQNMLAAVHFEKKPDGKSELIRVASVYPKDVGSILGWIKDGLTTYYHKGKAREWLSLLTRGSTSLAGRVQSELTQSWNQLQATPNVKTNEDIVKPLIEPPPELMMATRRMATTPAFKKWFAGSKVVEPDGSPKIVYHGTNADFDIFKKGDIGFHFGTVQAANDRLAAAHEMIEDWRVMGHGYPGYNILPVYLRIENPVRLPDLGSWHHTTVAMELRDRKIFTQQEVNQVEVAGALQEDANSAIVKLLVDKGYDGIVYRNVGEGRRKLSPEEIKAREIEVKRMYPESSGPLADTSMSAYDKTTNTLLAVGSTEKEARRLARDALETKTHAFDDSYIIFNPNQAKSAIGNIGTFDIGRPELQFATRRGKAAQAATEGISREASVEAAFERMHAAPGERLGLLERIKREYSRIRAQNVAAEAAAPAPQQIDPTAEIERLEAEETKALEDIDVEEQAALDASSQQIAERYADRILAEQDVDARRALERESKNVAAAQRKGIEKQFSERRKAIESDFRRQQQAVTLQAEQANLAATKEGAAQLAEMRRVHAFAELNALLKALPPAIRGRIGAAMTLAQARTTEASLTDFLTKRIAMIDRELERAFKAEYTERIKDLLARFKPKRAPSGVVKGRIGSDAQDVVIRVIDYIKMSGLAVQDEMRQIENELAVGGLEAEAESALLIEQHELSTFGAIDEMSAAELSAAHASLQDTIATGRAAWGASEEARLADMRAKAAEAKSALPPATAPGVSQKNRSIVLNWLKNYARNHTSFVQILGRLFPKASFVSDWESRAIKQDSADMDFVRQTQQRLVDAIGTALGTKNTVTIGSALGKMDVQNIPVPGGMASQREAIQYLFAWGQPQVRDRMLNQGWTDAHIATLQQATKDPVSQALMTFFRGQYEAIYQRANVVYQKLYGMNLPRIEGTYAPMRYHGAGGPAEISPTGASISSGVTPSAIKARIAHSALLRQVDSLEVFTEHLYQMSHWIHFAEFIRETRGVLNNADVKLALEQSIGREGMSDLQKQLDAVTRNGVVRSSDVSGINRFINHITKGVAVSSMAFNLHSAAVQGDSALRWMAAIPMQRWGNVLLAHRWLAAIPKAWHSDTVQRRVQQGTNPAVRAAMERNNLTPSLLLKAVDIGFWPINMLDGAATAVSSAIVYADSIQQGLTEEQALQKMDEAVARFSQPIAVTSKTQALVNAGPAMKMLLMFMADPMLKTSIAMDGMMDIGRGKFEQGMRKIIAVELWSLTSQLILNTWAHYIIGEDDEDEDAWLFKNFWRAAIMAPIQGFFVLGDITEGLVRKAFGEKWWKKDTAVGRFVGDMIKTISHWEDIMTLDPSDADFQKEVGNLIKVGGTMAGSGWAAAGAAIQRGVTGYQGAQEKLKE